MRNRIPKIFTGIRITALCLTPEENQLYVDLIFEIGSDYKKHIALSATNIYAKEI